MTTAAKKPELFRRVVRKGRPGLLIAWHPGQLKAMRSRKRIVAVIAGGRSGKTSLGTGWLWREMRRQGAGDYLVTAPTHPLLELAAAPEVELFFGTMLQLGRLVRGRTLQFRFSEEGCVRMWGHVPERPPRILFRHATDPGALEAMSLRGAWLDEAGLPAFRLASWQAIRQRLVSSRGRILISTKPYTVGGWLKKEVFDPWEAARRAGGDHPDIDVVSFGMGANPAVPKEEIARLRAAYPAWKSSIEIDGHFERPAGRIYDCWDEGLHVVADMPVPWGWKRVGGLDFGGVNTAGVVAVQPPGSGTWYIAREYRAGGTTAAGHAAALRKLALCGHQDGRGEPVPRAAWWCGGAGSEDHWRREFAQAGMPVAPPAVSDVEVGIQRVYAMLATGRLKVFRSCEHVIDQLSSYSRVVDDAGEPTEEIEAKETYHVVDSIRYMCSRLEGEDRRPAGRPGAIERKVR
jgi:hypothetical protein